MLCCEGVKAPLPRDGRTKRAVVSCFLESGLIPPHACVGLVLLSF